MLLKRSALSCVMLKHNYAGGEKKNIVNQICILTILCQ